MLPNSAPNISYPKMILLLENLKLDIRSRISIIKLRMTLRPRRAMYIYIYIYIHIYLYMPFALQLLKDWQGLGPGISLLRMLVECQITEDWSLTTRGIRL